MKRSRTVGVALDALRRDVQRRREERHAERHAALESLPQACVWHVGITAINREMEVEAALRARGMLAYCPCEIVSIGDREKRRDATRPLMPRYVFFSLAGAIHGRAPRASTGDVASALDHAGMQIAPRRLCRAITRGAPEDRGVMGIDGLQDVLAETVSQQRRWRIAPSQAVEALIAAERAGAFNRTDGARRQRRAEIVQRLKPGDSVTIQEGWLAGMAARVLKVKPAKRLTVLLELFGNGLRAELPVDSLAVAP